MTELLAGKNILIMGVANEKSIAWGIAKSLSGAGANLIFTYESDRVKDRVTRLTDTIPGATVLPCNVTVDEDIDALAELLREKYGVLHGFVHSIAFARGEDLDGDFASTSRDGFALAHDISAYSLVAVTNRVAPLMTEGGSIMAMTYIGSERAVKNYNVMGVAKAALESSVRYLAYDLGKHNIRVNAISAGPVRTLSAKGIKGFSQFHKTVEDVCPLPGSVNPDEVGDTALFLASHLSRGITGEIIYVDHGFRAVGVTY